MTDHTGMTDRTDADTDRVLFARIGFGVLSTLAALTTLAAFTTLDLGSAAQPAPGFWVACVSVMTLLLVVAALLNPRIVLDEVSRISKSEASVVAQAVPLLVLAPSLLTTLGLIITTAIASCYWFAVVTRTGLVRSLIGAVAITVGIEVVFLELLQVPFPAGSWTGVR
ncbi:tripartite tricarboxylate transporter TctB family protein [Phytoactinopolyspora halotolerans]|uniref:DUF1468 domain-containing protein n=1 Tax=Phytoactinopolyspora halotolerans TaxID=1981512 RepID=A0A6L9S8F6_9ACTN|nr:tripartite tricarboxylate transporter TctB family protein [Phytoactinopolyspora halotolerans]NEE00874.1 hypothetical protein [Phytoactinopolyspora halotolerans]